MASSATLRASLGAFGKRQVSARLHTVASTGLNVYKGRVLGADAKTGLGDYSLQSFGRL